MQGWVLTPLLLTWLSVAVSYAGNASLVCTAWGCAVTHNDFMFCTVPRRHLVMLAVSDAVSKPLIQIL